MRRVVLVAALLGCSVNSSGTADDVDLEDSSADDTSAGGADSDIDATGETSTIFDGEDLDTGTPVVDTGTIDSFVMDTFVPDTFMPDTVVPDTFVPDTFVADTFVPDTACPTCPPLATCVSGACTCPTNSSSCIGKCLDIKYDPDRCGNCDLGLPCDYGTLCSNSVCKCQPGLTLCGPVCVDTKGHANACGGCSPCGPNQRCVDGKCTPAGGTSCPSNRPDECPSSDGKKSCFDFNTDPMHCGGCATDKRCKANEFCVKGACESYAVGVGCTTCPCSNCATILPGSRCCSPPPGWPADRVVCVDAGSCPMWLP